MIGVSARFLLLAALPLPAYATDLSGNDAARVTCIERLDRSLAEMESRPFLKEELATGLMWLRLDAEMALETGDTELCLSKVETVETILGIAVQDN